MQTQAVESSIEHTSIGRVVVPPGVPRGFKVFYTTIDFANICNRIVLPVRGGATIRPR